MKLFEFSDKQASDIVSILNEKYKKVVISKMAIEKAKNMIAKAISKAEIKVYKKSKEKIEETADELYYQLNIMPNPNETGTDFWYRCIEKLLTKKRCLVIHLNQGFFIVDSYTETDDVTKERIYSDIIVSSGYKTTTLKKKFKSGEVIDLRLSNKKIVDLLDGFNSQIDDLASAAINAYKKTHVNKYRFISPGPLNIKDKEGNPVTQSEYANKIKTDLDSDEVEVILTAAGVDIKEIKSEISSNVNDVSFLIEQIYKATALAFDIPVSSFNGTITEKSDASNEFMTYCVDWFVELVNDSLNSKCVGLEGYMSGERIKLDVSNFKHIDVIDSATNLDKLYQDGWSHNDILKLVGKMPIDEDWANIHHTTKNYENVNLEESKKGGE